MPVAAVTPDVRVRAHEVGYQLGATGARWALRDIAIELPVGSWTCLLGVSGVGKSTLLKAIAGLVPEARLDVETSDGKPLTGRIAYMAQDDLLLPWLDVRSNVALGRRLRGEAVDDAALNALVASVGLESHARRLPAELSGGMRQRAALARTLFEARPLVLMDEPFSALDALTRYKLQALSHRLLHGRTVLLVTHDPHEALRLGQRIHVLSGEPARLDPAICPDGPAPREPGDARALQHLPLLLAQLGMQAAA